MQIKDLKTTLENLTDYKITQDEIAKALGIKKSAISKKMKNPENLLKKEEIEKLEQYFNVNLSGDSLNIQKNSSPITFYDVKGSCGTGSLVLYEPEISTIWLDNNLIYKILHTKPDNLHIIQAKGDSMEGVDIFEGDILLVDKSRRDPMISGIYVFTTQNNELVYIKRLRLRPDGILEVISENKSYETLYYTSEDLGKIDFQIKGRIIKNISRGL